MNTITLNLKHLMKTHHLTQADLAHHLNTNQATINRKISTKTRLTLTDLTRLAPLFHQPVGQFVETLLTPPPQPDPTITHLKTPYPLFNSIILKTDIRYAYIPATSHLAQQLMHWYAYPQPDTPINREQFLRSLDDETWQTVTPSFTTADCLATHYESEEQLREDLLTLIGGDNRENKRILDRFLTYTPDNPYNRETVISLPASKLPPAHIRRLRFSLEDTK